MMQESRRGSMTIFACMTIMLVSAFLFSLLEGAREFEMRKLAVMNSDAVVESLFAGYLYPMWDTYRLLGIPTKGEDGENLNALVSEALRISTVNDSYWISVGLGTDLLRLRTEAAEISRYKYLTDQGGEVFIVCTAAYMRNNAMVETLDSILNYSASARELLGSKYADTSSVEEAKKALEELKQQEDSEADGQGDTELEQLPESEDPTLFDTYQTVQSMGILGLVLENPSTVSGRSIPYTDVVSARSLSAGKDSQRISVDKTDALFMDAYLMKYMSSFADPISGRALTYEKEYLVGHKLCDTDNLKAVVNRILAIREAANLMYLMTDGVKMGEAESMALALAGATANPLIIELVKLAILTMWAFFESILDLRTLLVGEKIPFIKSAEYWTSDLAGLASVSGSFLRAKSCATGISYTDYLSMLILLQSDAELAMNAMDVMEATMRVEAGLSEFRMDKMVVEAQVSYLYSYPTIFLGMEGLTRSHKGRRNIQKTAEYSYRKAGA